MSNDVEEITRILVRNIFQMTNECEAYNDMLGLSKNELFVDMVSDCYWKLTDHIKELYVDADEYCELVDRIFTEEKERAVAAAKRILVAYQPYEVENDTAWI